MTQDGSATWLMAATSEANKDEWVAAIQKAFGADPAKPPTGALKRKSSLIMRAKKKVAGKAATSGVGKRLIKSVMRDDEADQLFDSGKAIVTRDKDKKFADQLEVRRCGAPARRPLRRSPRCVRAGHAHQAGRQGHFADAQRVD